MISSEFPNQFGDKIYKLVPVNTDEEDLVDTESLAYKAQHRPGAIELLNKRFDELQDQFKSTKQELETLKRRHLLFSFNFRVMNLTQTVLNLEIELINRYIPIAINVLNRKHVRFSDIYEARTIYGLEIEVESFFKNPLVVALVEIKNSN